MRVLTLLVVASACGTPSSTAWKVCNELVAAGVANDCSEEVEREHVSIRFVLTGTGSHGYVSGYANDEAYRRALHSFGEIDALFERHGQRPHRYSHDRKRVSVMLVHGADAAAQSATQRVVDAL